MLFWCFYLSVYFCVVLVIACCCCLFLFFPFVRVYCVCLLWFLKFIVMVMIIFGLTVFFIVKVPSFILFYETLCFFPWFLVVDLYLVVWGFFVYLFYFHISFIGVVWLILWVWFDFLWYCPLGYVNLCFYDFGLRVCFSFRLFFWSLLFCYYFYYSVISHF